MSVSSAEMTQQEDRKSRPAILNTAISDKNPALPHTSTQLSLTCFLVGIKGVTMFLGVCRGRNRETDTVSKHLIPKLLYS